MLVNLQQNLNCLKNDLEFQSNVKVLEFFCNDFFELQKLDYLVVMQINSVDLVRLNLSLKIYVKSEFGLKKCYGALNEVVSKLLNSKNFFVENLQALAISFNKTYDALCQEIKICLTNKNVNEPYLLTFGTTKIKLHKKAIFKIVRQINFLGATFNGVNFYDYGQPLKTIEGTFLFNEQQFNDLINFLNEKTVQPLSFKNQKFNATLIELILNKNNVVEFKFLEDLNEV